MFTRHLPWVIALTACGPDDTRLTNLSERGTVCVENDDTLRVNFGGCLSSSCDTLLEASCAARVSGSTTLVTASALVETLIGQECSSDCVPPIARCPIPDDADRSGDLVYAATTRPFAQSRCANHEVTP